MKINRVSQLKKFLGLKNVRLNTLKFDFLNFMKKILNAHYFQYYNYEKRNNSDQ